MGLVSVVSHEFRYSASKTAHEAAIFDGNYGVEFSENFVEHCFVEWLHEAHVVVCCGNTSGFQSLYGFRCLRTDGTDAQNGNVVSGFEFPSLTNLNGFERLSPVHDRASTSGVAD